MNDETPGMSAVAYPTLQIATKACDRYRELSEKCARLQRENPRWWNEDLLDATMAEACVAVVFSAMFLESFMYRQARQATSERYYQKHLESLSVTSKWIVIPKLLYGRTIDEDCEAFRSLTTLINARNRVAHAKVFSLDKVGKVAGHGRDLEDAALKAVDTIVGILDEFKKCKGNDDLLEIDAIVTYCKKK
jgi:hypothetical protein